MRERTATTDELTYLHGDHLGSASLATDAQGGVVSEMRYYPYGETRSGTLPIDYRYTGQRWEDGLGLYDYNARYYDPLIGRFSSADTIVPSPGDPQSLNRYAYVQNNPLKYTDPSGHALWAGDGGGIAPLYSGSPLHQERAENDTLTDNLSTFPHTFHQNSDLSRFLQLLHSIHPGSIGILGPINRFNVPFVGHVTTPLPVPGHNVGHALIGAADGVFIGTGGKRDGNGVYFSSAAAIFRDKKWREHLTIYEVEGLDDLARKRAAKFAMERYGSGYSYAGLIPFSDPTREGKGWYCTELTVAALEQAGVTFYLPMGTSPPMQPLRTPTFPLFIPTYRTLVGGQSLAPSPHSRWGNTQPLLQTWP